MHDDEFFSSSHAISGFTASSAPVAAGATVAAAAAAKNPLSIDEVTSFSKQLLNIVFPLYWRDNTSEGGTGALSIVPGVPGMTWVAARELMTSCLQALHAREFVNTLYLSSFANNHCSSRRSFTPPNHWIMTSEADAKPFVQAALFEAEQIEENSQDARPTARRWTKKMERQSAAYGPRLLVLNNIPFTVPFEVRVAVFRGWIAKDMQTLAGCECRTPLMVIHGYSCNQQMIHSHWTPMMSSGACGGEISAPNHMPLCDEDTSRKMASTSSAVSTSKLQSRLHSLINGAWKSP